jgi:perosamine synthetase
MKTKHLPYGQHWIEDDDIQAVVDVLRSDWITQGQTVELFERAVAEFCQAEYAVAVSSATAGLHLACLASGVRGGRDVITSPLTFVASANAALYCGGRVYFSDIDPASYNLCPLQLDSALHQGRVGKDIAALIPVHFAGQCCAMESLAEIARQQGSYIIEDASHALGGSWVDQAGLEHRIGSCSHSDMTVFSFHPVKHITTGEGGVVLTNDPTSYELLRELRNHGVTKNPDKIDQAVGPWYYEMQHLGYNYRITDFQCALGVNQLKKLDSWITRRREIASLYDTAFAQEERLIAPYQAEFTRSAYHLYPVQIKGRDRGSLRRKIFEILHSRGIGVQVHYIPVHMQPYYREQFGYREGDFPVAEGYYEQAISLPIFPKMSDEDVERVIVELKNALAKVE